MARIILNQTFQFTNPGHPSRVFQASPLPQEVPDWVFNSPEFEELKSGGVVDVLDKPPVATKIVDIGGGKKVEFPQTVEPDVAELSKDEHRQVNAHVDSLSPPKAGVEVVLTDAERRAKSLRKSSGIDGPTGDWTTEGMSHEGYPVPKGSPEDATATPAENAAYWANKGK